MDFGAFQPVLDFLKVFVQESQVKWIVAMAFLNVIVAIAAALKNGDFKIQKLGEFLWKKVGLYGGVYAIAWMVSEAMGDQVQEASMAAGAVWGVLQLMLVGDLAESLGEMGVPWPDAVRNAVAKGGG